MPNIFLYIFYAIITLILLIIAIPVRIKVRYLNDDDELNENKNIEELKIIIYILKYIPIYVYKGEKKKSDLTGQWGEWLNKISSVKGVMGKIKEYINIYKEMIEYLRNVVKHKYFLVKEFELNMVFNTGDVIANAYLNMIANTTLAMSIANMQDIFELENTVYRIRAMNEKVGFKIRIYSIFEFNIVKNIHARIFKILKRWRENGTSNRKFDANSND